MKSKLLLSLLLALNTLPSVIQATPTPAPTFELPKWQSKKTLKLADFAGQIVVLDFFAYWCGPCRLASQDIEPNIQKYYAAKHGNAAGVPVNVVAVNVEENNPALTADFIKDVGADLVANDLDSALFTKLGGEGTPFIVVIDGTHASKDHPDFRIVYQSSGYEGSKHLRKVIDAIKPMPAS